MSIQCQLQVLPSLPLYYKPLSTKELIKDGILQRKIQCQSHLCHTIGLTKAFDKLWGREGQCMRATRAQDQTDNCTWLEDQACDVMHP